MKREILRSCLLSNHLIVFPKWSAVMMQFGTIIVGRQAGDRYLLDLILTCDEAVGLPDVSIRRVNDTIWRDYDLGEGSVELNFGPKNGTLSLRNIEPSSRIELAMIRSILSIYSSSELANMNLPKSCGNKIGSQSSTSERLTRAKSNVETRTVSPLSAVCFN